MLHSASPRNRRRTSAARVGNLHQPRERPAAAAFRSRSPVTDAQRNPEFHRLCPSESRRFRPRVAQEVVARDAAFQAAACLLGQAPSDMAAAWASAPDEIVESDRPLGDASSVRRRRVARLTSEPGRAGFSSSSSRIEVSASSVARSGTRRRYGTARRGAAERRERRNSRVHGLRRHQSGRVGSAS